MKILFIGCVESSRILLDELLTQNFKVCGVITKKQSMFNSDFCDLSELCSRYNIDSFYAENVNDRECVDFIKQKNPDVIFCFGWSQLIRSEILDYPRLGIIGFHPAKLPYNKGRHPIIWTLVLGMDKTASTFFLMNEGADTGSIVSQEDISVSYEDDAGSLYQKIMDVAKKQVITIANKLKDNTLSYIETRDTVGNSWRKRGRADGIIDWRMSSRAIYNLIRALTKPYVGAEFIYNGQSIKVWKAEEVNAHGMENIEFGRIIKVVSDTNYYIKAYDNVIHVINSDPVVLKEGECL